MNSSADLNASHQLEIAPSSTRSARQLGWSVLLSPARIFGAVALPAVASFFESLASSANGESMKRKLYLLHNLVLITALAVLLAGCIAPQGPLLHDQIGLSFEIRGGQLIPRGLPQPEAWVYLGKKMVPGKALDMTWVKPVVMPPRQDQSGNPPLDDENSEAVVALLDKAHPGKAPEWSECFEYVDLPLPATSPQEYLAGFTKNLKSHCPTASVIPIRVSGTDLLLEINSGGCELYGDQAEIDCFLFGKTDLFHMNYTVKSRELTPEQRGTGIKLVTTWKIKHPN
jgi:hypothetical protein